MRQQLLDEVNSQKKPFAVIGLFVHAIGIKGTMDAIQSVTKAQPGEAIFGWHDSVSAAISDATKSHATLLNGSSDSMAVIINPCSFTTAGKISRLIRNRLFRDHPLLQLNVATRQVDKAVTDGNQLIYELYQDLSQNVNSNSTQIEVKSYGESSIDGECQNFKRNIRNASARVKISGFREPNSNINR